MASESLSPGVRSAVLINGVGCVFAACNFREEGQLFSLRPVTNLVRLAWFDLLVTNSTLAIDVESPHIEVTSISNGG
jgi:hypothetical protein